jgi:hypothetical protein
MSDFVFLVLSSEALSGTLYTNGTESERLMEPGM